MQIDTETTPDSSPIPARMLNELVYCPRLYWLEHVAGEWDENSFTLQGERVHKVVDAKSTEFPVPSELPDSLKIARSVDVGSTHEGIVAKVDLIEMEHGKVAPVDYKRGSVPSSEQCSERAWPADRVQIGAQALALRDAGYQVDHGVLYYAQSKTRVDVPITDSLITEVRTAVTEAQRIRKLKIAPPPLVGSPKCPRCSLVGICLPDEITALTTESTHQASANNDQAVVVDEVVKSADSPLRTVRQLTPARNDRMPLYVQTHGAVIGRDGECLSIRSKDGKPTTARMNDISQVNVLGNVTITASAMHELCKRDINVGLFGYGGWYYGSISGFSEKNALLRITQFAWAADGEKSLSLAQEFVSAKILNCRTLLRRNASSVSAQVLGRLKTYAHEAKQASEVPSLLGIEGSAARLYFEHFASMLSAKGSSDVQAFSFEHRNRRPPKDPVNAMLSFGYALLAKDCKIALGNVGFDPMVGMYHQPRHGRPALALDLEHFSVGLGQAFVLTPSRNAPPVRFGQSLRARSVPTQLKNALMEEFRPILVDSCVLNCVNTETIKQAHFVHAAGGCALNEDGRKTMIAAYERRMDTEVTHPLFGYSVSYRRILEVQARLLARTIEGELLRYPSFRTR